MANGEWMTYAELAGRLGTTVEGARQRAIRGRWSKRKTNDGKTQVLADLDDLANVRTGVRTTVEQPSANVDERATVEALNAHVETLRVALAAAEATAATERARADRERAMVEEKTAELVRALADLATANADAGRAKALADELAEIKARGFWRRLVG